MNQSTSKIGAKTILLQVEIARQRGVSLEQQCQRAGLDLESLQDPEGTIDATVVYDHLEFMLEQEDPIGYALEVGAAHRSSTLGALGMQLRACASARAAFDCLQRYSRLFNRLTRLELHERGQDAVWMEFREGPRRPGSHLAGLISMAATRTIMLEVAQREIQFRKVALTGNFSQDGDQHRLESFFECPIVTDHSHAEIVFEQSLLDHPIDSADELLLAHFTELMERRKQKQNESDPKDALTSVRLFLLRRLPAGAPSIDEVAEALNLSRRTLQRRLLDHGFRYSELLNELRVQLAESYLQDPHLSCAEIAHFLGYNEANSFFRAFRRWKGMTPEEFRNCEV